MRLNAHKNYPTKTCHADSSSWWLWARVMELPRAVVLLLDPVALPHVLPGVVGSLMALVGGLGLAGGELRSVLLLSSLHNCL